MRSILIDPENPAKMWVGGVQGGIWKTTNGGSSWSPVNDFLASIAVSCMAMDPQDPDIMYAGTGESFAANIGGRMIGTSFAWVTATLAVTADRAHAPTKLAMVAAVVGTAVYVVGFVASFWLPEPKREDLPE